MVFSGIVEEIGVVEALVERDDVLLWNGERTKGWVLTIAAKVVLHGASIGCSIAVNGVCLTVTAFDDARFTVGLAPETMRRTALGDLKAGDGVNLERSLPADGRNSGHMVQGHVDGTGVILGTWREGDSLWVRIGVEAALLRHIIPKGYVAVDGTSLTVCDVTDGAFTLMLIAHTQHAVVLPRKAVGARVNIEPDVAGKYAAAAVSGVAAVVAALDARVAALTAAVTARLDALDARVARLERGPASGGAAT